MSFLKFNNVYIKDNYVLVGPKESKGKLKKFDYVINDYYFDTKSFESAEIKMQRTVIDNLLNKIKKADYIIGGDLLNQIAISTYSAKAYDISFLGMYSACATFIEELTIGSNLIESGNASNIICITSSHNLVAERQYRYPIEYGNTKPLTSTTTLTSAVGCILSNKKGDCKVLCATVGKVTDLCIKDVNNMGAVMAPACGDTLYEHLNNFNKNLNDYDLIITGDLGKVGLNILKEYYEKSYHKKIVNIMDAGSNIYKDSQNTYAGGSGPCCLPLYFFSKILNEKKYHKILLLGTGSLHTPILVNKGQSIPSISHAIEIEVK